MKKFVKIGILLAALFVAVSVTGKALGVNPMIILGVSVVMALCVPSKGFAFMAVNLNQVIVAELLNQFRNINDDFLAPLKDFSSKVNNDVIKFNDIGADPNVLIDNTTYPIASAARTDEGIVVSLHKMETENTIITDDELHALPYDKKSSVMSTHLLALKKARVQLGLYSLAPAADSADTPVIETTGALTAGRRALTIADLVNAKKRFDLLEIPLESRNLVLCPDHVGDLLMLDNAFRDRYNNISQGAIIKQMYGFSVYENIHKPTYFTDGTKNAYGAASAGTDRNASTIFSNVNAMKAVGSASMYYLPAAQNPEMRESIIGFRMYFIVSPVSTKGVGAIVAGLDGGSV